MIPSERTHPEGWRDWPCEAPPTLSPHSRRKKVAIPSGSKTTAWEMRRRARASRTSVADPGGGTEQMPATALKCKECSAEYPLEARYVCERCFGPLEVAYTAPEALADELKRRIQAGPLSLWRYADFLPVRGTGYPLPTGFSPLVRADRLARRLGLREVWVKNETANPTHSFKDRVVSVALARALELGFDTIACASTGNLANAVAAHSAAAGVPSYVFIPADLEPEKILANAAYGSRVVGVRGNYDAVNRLCTELSADRE